MSRTRSLCCTMLAAVLLFPGLLRAELPKEMAKPKEAAKAKELKWVTSYDGAIAFARKENRVILAYFSGSDWCPWCQKLDKEVLNTEMFRLWAEKNVIPFQVDFPKEKKLSATLKIQNDKLKLKYGIGKTPT